MALNDRTNSNIKNNMIQLFSNPKFGEIRVAEIDGKTYFVGYDVAKALGYSNTRDAISRHCKGVVIHDIPTNGGVQSMSVISEGDIYRLAAKSQLPGAEEFESWIFDEVLPSIRRNGMYATDITVEKMISDPDFAIKLLTNLKEERIKRVEAESKVVELQPKALFADAVATSTQSCLIGELSKILRQNGIEIGQNRLFEYLRKNGYLCQFRERYNQPTQRAMEMELFEVKKTVINKPDGSILVSTTTKVTGKGCIYFVNKFLKQPISDFVK